MKHGVDKIPELEDEDEETRVHLDRTRVHLDASYKSELYDEFLEDLKQQAADNGNKMLQVSSSYFLQVLRNNYKVFTLSYCVLSLDLI